MEIHRAIAELGIRPEVLIGGLSMHVDIYLREQHPPCSSKV